MPQARVPGPHRRAHPVRRLGRRARSPPPAPDELEELHLRLHDWARDPARAGGGVAAGAIGRGEALPERVLARTGGERTMTDLRHVGELLHGAIARGRASASRRSPRWLRRRLLEADRESGDEERSRRLESDCRRRPGADHPPQQGPRVPDRAAPVPVGRRRRRPRAPAPVCFHDPAAGDARRLDVTLERRRHTAPTSPRPTLEDRGEDLRLLYVALTRARHQAVVWWAGAWESAAVGARPAAVRPRRTTARSRPFGARARPTTPWRASGCRTSPRAAPTGAIAVERRATGGAARLGPAARAGGRARPGGAHPRASIAAGGGPPTATSPPGRTRRRGGQRAGGRPASPTSRPGSRRSPPSPRRRGRSAPDAELPLAAMAVGRRGRHDHPRGARGDGLHRRRTCGASSRARLDAARPGPLRRRSANSSRCSTGWPRRSTRRSPGSRCARWRAPTGSTSSEFELPLAGGDAPERRGDPRRDGRGARARAARRTIRSPATPPGCDDPELRARRPRLPHRLPRPRRPPPRPALSHRRLQDELARRARRAAARLRTTAPEALRAEMERRHYGLQALFYTVALHRYLRWRLPGYDPGRHLGGVHYAFLRGMTGAARRRSVQLDAAGRGGERRSAMRSTGAAAGERALARPVRRPLRARGARSRCGAFNAAGVLAAADVHVGGAVSARWPARRDADVPARARARGARAAPRSRPRRPGHDRRDRRGRHRAAGRRRCAAVAASRGVAGGGGRLAARRRATARGRCGSRAAELCVERMWAAERRLAERLRAQSVAGRRARPATRRRRRSTACSRRRTSTSAFAAALAAERRLAVIAGGPGTGKTTTVARIVALLGEQARAARRAAAAGRARRADRQGVRPPGAGGPRAAPRPAVDGRGPRAAAPGWRR